MRRQQIFYLGFTSLPQDATMANARAATEAAADELFGAASQQWQSTSRRVGSGRRRVGPGATASCVVANAPIPFESPHPY